MQRSSICYKMLGANEISFHKVYVLTADDVSRQQLF